MEQSFLSRPAAKYITGDQGTKKLDFYIERFSLERRKTKTKVITLANDNRRRQSTEPIRTGNKYMSPVPSAGKRVWTGHNWFSWCYF